MPPLYRCPSGVPLPGKTTYLTVRGKDTIFPGDKGIGLADVTDGTSNTILVVEAGDQSAVEWTKPDDFTPDPKNPTKGLLGHHPGGLNVVMADCSVHFISASIDPKVLWALFTRNGGEVIGEEDLYGPPRRVSAPGANRDEEDSSQGGDRGPADQGGTEAGAASRGAAESDREAAGNQTGEDRSAASGPRGLARLVGRRGRAEGGASVRGQSPNPGVEQRSRCLRSGYARFPVHVAGLGGPSRSAKEAAAKTGWHGPYLSGPVPNDPWGRPYQYAYPGKHGGGNPDVWSLGPDGRSGTEDDIGNWSGE